jgi:hypothetical protein
MPSATVTSEIEAEVSFAIERVDYGVSGSPEWDEILPDTMELESLHMFGRDWSEKELRITFGDMGTDAMLGLIYEQVEEWDDE